MLLLVSLVRAMLAAKVASAGDIVSSLFCGLLSPLGLAFARLLAVICT